MIRKSTSPAIGCPSAVIGTGCQPIKYELIMSGIDNDTQISKMLDPNALETAPESSPRLAAPIDRNVSGTEDAAATKMTAMKKHGDF